MTDPIQLLEQYLDGIKEAEKQANEANSGRIRWKGRSKLRHHKIKYIVAINTLKVFNREKKVNVKIQRLSNQYYKEGNENTNK